MAPNAIGYLFNHVTKNKIYMKKINLNAKLNLNKKTVSRLSDTQMDRFRGGAEDGGADTAAEAGFLSIGKTCTNNYRCSCDITKSLFCHK